MAENAEEHLDRFTGLIGVAVGRVSRKVARIFVKEVLSDVGFDRFKTELSNLAAALADDGDDAGLDEYVESVKKKEARKSAEQAAEKLHTWANR